jgi:hypothetical protein
MKVKEVIPPERWQEFLQAFSKRHSSWLVTFETHDLETFEDVSSRSMPLQSMDLDLEDEKNPRINVIVRSENKEIKHILFQPSQLILYSSEDGTEQALRVETVNTSTIIRLRQSPSLAA